MCFCVIYPVYSFPSFDVAIDEHWFAHFELLSKLITKNMNRAKARLADVALSPFLKKLSLNHVFEETLKLLHLLCHVNTGMLTKQFVLHHIIQFE